MTGYQKLKVENEILWKELEYAYICLFADYLDRTEKIDKKLDDIKWQIKRAQHEKKN